MTPDSDTTNLYKPLIACSYTVEAQQGKLEILHGLSGYACGGRLLAVMGASGSG